MININGFSKELRGAYLNGTLLDVKGIKLDGQIVLTFGGEYFPDILDWYSFRMKSWQPMENNIPVDGYSLVLSNSSNFVIEHLTTVCLANPDIFEVEVTGKYVNISILNNLTSYDGHSLSGEHIQHSIESMLSDGYFGRFSELRHYINSVSSSGDEADIDLNCSDNEVDYIVSLIKQIPIFACYSHDGSDYGADGFGPYYWDLDRRALISRDDSGYWASGLPTIIPIRAGDFNAEYPIMTGPAYLGSYQYPFDRRDFAVSAASGMGIELVVFNPYSDKDECKEILEMFNSIDPYNGEVMYTPDLNHPINIIKPTCPGAVPGGINLDRIYEHIITEVCTYSYYSESDFFGDFNNILNENFGSIVFFRQVSLDKEYFEAFLSESNPYGYSPDLNSELSKEIKKYLAGNSSYDAVSLHELIAENLHCSKLYMDSDAILYVGTIDSDIDKVGDLWEDTHHLDWYMNTTPNSILDYISTYSDTIALL